MKKLTVLSIVIIAAVVALPLAGLVLRSGSSFGGADSGGQAAITQIDPTYRPWFHSIWTQSVTTNYIMFGIQGVLGAGVLFAALGYLVGRSRGRTEAAAGVHSPLRAGTTVAYAVIAAVAFAVAPVLYYVAGYRPPSTEIICLFFALDGAIASGSIFFALFFFRGRRKGRAQIAEACSQAASTSGVA